MTIGAGAAQAATLSITTSSLPAGRQLSAYSATLVASGGTAPYHWSVSGSLPAGLALSSAGVITGTPTAAGTVNVTVKVTDSATPTAGSATRTLPLTVLAPLNQSIVYALNAENSTVTEYAPGASGNAAPFATIGGPATQMGFEEVGIAVSPARKVVVSGQTTAGVSAIFEFAPGAAGNVAPQAVISGSATGLNRSLGVALDKAGDIWVADVGNSTITEYTPTASGNAAPRLILGGAATGLRSPAHLTFDAAGNLWVSNAATPSSTVTEYPASALQQTSSQPVNLAPIATVQSSRVQMGSGLTFDPRGGLHVQDAGGRSLVGFAPGTLSGNPLPEELLNGTSTELGFGLGVAADPAGRLFVASGIVLVFNETSSGNIAPLSTLYGDIDGVIDVAVSPPAPLLYSGAFPLRVTVGASYSYALNARGGVGPYHYAVASGMLPAGLSLSPSGVISGVATASGTTTVPIRISDSALPTAASATEHLQIITGAAPPVAVSTASLPSTTVGQDYVASLTATGGIPPYTWAVTGGALPPDLSLSAAGKLSGTPSLSGSFTFTVTASDSASPTPQTAARTLTLTVNVAPGVYVTSAGNDSVLEYRVGQGGDILPTAAISGPATGLSSPEGVVLDALGDVFVANEGNNTVTEYPPGASGDASPIMTIKGVSTPCRLALSGSGHLYVASLPGPITEYQVGSGTATQLATLSGQNQPRGLALDAAGHLWVSESVVNEVSEYASNASGSAAPIANLIGPDTGLTSPQGLVFDASGNLTVANAGTNGSDGTVTVYPAGQLSGDTAPSQRITTGLAEPLGVDRGTDNTVFVADVGGNSVVEYAPGTASPSQVISGPLFTGLSVPVGVAATPPLSIVTKSLRAARRGRRYLVNLVAAEGTTPYRWRLTRGRLPAGLRLRRSGAIIGTPRGRPHLYRFTVKVVDSTHPRQTATRRLGLRVKPAPPRKRKHPKPRHQKHKRRHPPKQH